MKIAKRIGAVLLLAVGALAAALVVSFAAQGVEFGAPIIVSGTSLSAPAGVFYIGAVIVAALSVAAALALLRSPQTPRTLQAPQTI